MIITCPNCNASLQIDETKATVERFSIRCPKCQSPIPVQIKNATPEAAPVQNSRAWGAPQAVAYKKPKINNDETIDSIKNDDLMKALAAALQQKTVTVMASPQDDFNQTDYRVLLCLNQEQRESTAQILDEAGYKVFLADNVPQATEKIRDEDVDVVVFSLDFAAKFNGANALQQMINSLLPIERRRVFVVAIDPNAQTLNMHEAFLRNLNLLVNTSELNHLPSILTRALRDYHDLYRHYKHAVATVK